MKKISEAVGWVKKHGLFPNVPIVESKGLGFEVKVDDEDYRMTGDAGQIGTK